MQEQFTTKQAFSLLETILAMAIIGILAGLTLVAVSPVRVLNAADDAILIQNVREIALGIETYMVDNGGKIPTVGGNEIPVTTSDNIIDQGTLVQNVDGINPNYVVFETIGVENNFYIGKLTSGNILIAVELKNSDVYTLATAQVETSDSDTSETQTTSLLFTGYNDTGWDFFVENIADGDFATYGQENDHGEAARLTSNSYSGDQLGEISSVEMRVLWEWNNPTQTWLYLQPYFNGNIGGEIFEDNTRLGNNLGSGGAFTEWYDITNATGAPTEWTWNDVENLDIGIGLIRNGWGLMRVFEVELLVTYEE